MIPAGYHRRVIDAYTGPKRVIDMPGAGHDSPLTAEASRALADAVDGMWATVRPR